MAPPGDPAPSPSVPIGSHQGTVFDAAALRAALDSDLAAAATSAAASPAAPAALAPAPAPQPSLRPAIHTPPRAVSPSPSRNTPHLSAAAAPHSSHGSPLPPASGCSSPVAPSERSGSVATSSAVPFSYLAKQRRLHERSEALAERAQEVVATTEAVFDARMELHGVDVELLTAMNGAAAREFAGACDVAAALAQFALDMALRQEALVAALDEALPQLDAQLRQLEEAVEQLDLQSQQLEAGLRPVEGSAGSASAVAAAYSQALFKSLQQSLQLPRST